MTVHHQLGIFDKLTAFKRLHIASYFSPPSFFVGRRCTNSTTTTKKQQHSDVLKMVYVMARALATPSNVKADSIIHAADG